MTTKRMLKTLAVMSVMLSLAAVPAVAEPELDQSQTTIDNYAVVMNEPAVYQTFTAGRSGTLERVSVYAGCCYQAAPEDYNLPSPLYLRIKGPGVDTPAAEVPVDVSSNWGVQHGWMDVALSPAPYLRAGEQYKLWFTTDSYDGPSFHTFGLATSDVYAGGEVHVGECCFAGTEDGFQWVTKEDWDLGFRTYVTPDTTAPKVDTLNPADRAKGVARATDVTARFSEQMDPDTLTASTFRLFKVNADGTTTRITNAPVTPSADGLSATLNPYGASSTKLGTKTKYKAVVTTGAQDLAGNALDQDAGSAGNQQKVWYFTTGSR